MHCQLHNNFDCIRVTIEAIEVTRTSKIYNGTSIHSLDGERMCSPGSGGRVTEIYSETRSLVKSIL